MFEVGITKKLAEKAAKTSLLWQWTAFARTSNDLNVIVCDSKAIKRAFLLQLWQSFWSILDPNDKTSNTWTYSMLLMCCRSWLVDSWPFHPWWPMKLRLTNPRRTNSKMAAILFFLNLVMISGYNYCRYYFLKAFVVIKNVSRDEWTYICENQRSRISVCGR